MEEKMAEDQSVKKENVLVRGKKWLRRKANGTLEFLTKNPMVIMPAASILLGLFKIAMSGGGNGDKYLVEDEVTGEKLKVTHRLTNDEILELEDRMVDGQLKGRALNDMGVLKKERKRR